MHIIGNVLKGKDVNRFSEGNFSLLVAENGSISEINTYDAYNDLQFSPKHSVLVAFRGDISREVNSRIALNRTGIVSKRMGNSLILRNVSVLMPTKPCILNGVNIGVGIPIKAESFEDDRGWVQRTIMYFPDIDVSFNYLKEPIDLDLLLSGLNVFKICREYNERTSYDLYGAVKNGTLHILGKMDCNRTIQNFIATLVKKKVITNIPVLNIKDKCLNTDDSGCLYSYAGDLSNAWYGVKGNPTRYRVLQDSNCVDIMLYTDCSRVSKSLLIKLKTKGDELMVLDIKDYSRIENSQFVEIKYWG